MFTFTLIHFQILTKYGGRLINNHVLYLHCTQIETSRTQAINGKIISQFTAGGTRGREFPIQINMIKDFLQTANVGDGLPSY